MYTHTHTYTHTHIDQDCGICMYILTCAILDLALILETVLPLGKREPEEAVGLAQGEASTLRSLLGAVAGGRGEAARRLHIKL